MSVLHGHSRMPTIYLGSSRSSFIVNDCGSFIKLLKEDPNAAIGTKVMHKYGGWELEKLYFQRSRLEGAITSYIAEHHNIILEIREDHNKVFVLIDFSKDGLYILSSSSKEKLLALRKYHLSVVSCYPQRAWYKSIHKYADSTLDTIYDIFNNNCQHFSKKIWQRFCDED